MNQHIMKTRKKYTAQEKARIAFEALKGDTTLAELTKKYGIHISQINQWKKQLKESMPDVFSNRRDKDELEKDRYIEELHKQIGQLTIEVNWLKKKSDLFK